MGAVKLKGATSGSVTITAPDSGGDETLVLPGVSGELLPLAGGKILQIVRATDTTSRSTTSISYVDITGVTVSITPQKNTSAIWVIVLGQAVNQWTASDGQRRGLYRLLDEGNTVMSSAENVRFGNVNMTGTGTRQEFVPFVMSGYATPATTSTKTYRAQFCRDGDNVTVLLRGDLVTTQIFAIEVSA
jgi:hypothetical protein